MNTSNNASRWRSLTQEQYLKERVDDQLDWYNKKSTYNKLWFFRLQTVTLITAALVPVISLSSSEFIVRLLVAISGSAAAIAAGLITLFQFRDHWATYRSTAERLKFEKYLFLTGAEPYTGENAYRLFVMRIEATILEENISWNEKINSIPDKADAISQEPQLDETAKQDQR